MRLYYLRFYYIFVILFAVLGFLSLACSYTRQVPSKPQAVITDTLSLTRQPSSTSTLTQVLSKTPTKTKTSTPTLTFTSTLTPTSTATKTNTPTPTATSTATRTLSPGESWLYQAETSMKSVNSMKMDISLSTTSGIIPVTLTGGGVAERPNKVYIKLSFLMQNLEIFSLSPDEVYLKPLGSQNWELVTTGQMDLATSLLRNPWRLIDIRDSAISPILQSTESVNGVDCQIISMQIDLPIYLSSRAPEASNQIDLIASRASGDMWVGINDHLIHKVYIEMQIVNQNETTPVKATIIFSNYNEPVVFPPSPG